MLYKKGAGYDIFVRAKGAEKLSTPLAVLKTLQAKTVSRDFFLHKDISQKLCIGEYVVIDYADSKST